MPIMLLDTLKDYKVYLCSKSPRRQELLAGMGIDFEYLPTNVEEKHPDTDNPVEVAEYLNCELFLKGDRRPAWIRELAAYLGK